MVTAQADKPRVERYEVGMDEEASKKLVRRLRETGTLKPVV